MRSGRRLYLVFSREKELRFLSHLDMMRLWERALRRAQLPLRYTRGFHPHPRLSLALPLSVGMTAEAEWLEVEMQQAVPREEVGERVSAQLPAGIVLQRVEVAPDTVPALMAQVYGVEYEVQLRDPPPMEQVQDRLRRFAEAGRWPVEEVRQGKVRTFDLKRMVAVVEVGRWGPSEGWLHLVLLRREGRSVRLETVLQVLGLGPGVLFHRKGLMFRQEATQGE